MYKATIVIPNINGKGWLKDSIESVYAQTEQNFQLIVVDNGSTDESLEQARSYCSRANFTLIENGTNTGFSHAVNQGIAMAESEYVVLFNNDAFAEPQWLAELIRTAETDPKIFAVQSLMIRHFDRELADDAGDYVTWMGFACKTGDGRRASRYTRQKRIFSACGGAALYRKSILDEIGGFDENFFAYFEDVDLSLLDKADILQIGGAFHLPAFDGEGSARLLELARSKSVTTCMDVTKDRTGKWTAIAPCYPHLDYFLPSIEQAACISGTEDERRIADYFLERGVGTVAIKLGTRGCYCKNKDRAFYCGRYTVPVAETTGAGDAFVAGFLTELGHGGNLEDCVRFATAASAHAVQAFGATAGVPDYDTVRRFMAERPALEIRAD